MKRFRKKLVTARILAFVTAVAMLSGMGIAASEENSADSIDVSENTVISETAQAPEPPEPPNVPKPPDLPTAAEPPEQTAEAETTEVPEVPTESDVPEFPKVSDMPEAMEMPEFPEEDETPDVSGNIVEFGSLNQEEAQTPMMASMMASSGDMALAADDYSQWINIGNHKAPDGTNYKADSKFWYEGMVLCLESESADAKIRLQSDISVEENFFENEKNNWIVDINVKRNKVIDLNGKTIYIKPYQYDKDNTFFYGKNFSTGIAKHYTMFNIGNGSKLTIVDSKGGGKIRCDSWLLSEKDMDDAETSCVDMFNVLSGGELFINASGAEFVCGRSKKQYLYAASCNGPENEYCYDGYARGQVNGSVVIAGENSKVTVVGGSLLARGYSLTPSTGWKPSGDAESVKKCAVFQVAKGAEINITDGYFKGCGGADVFQYWYSDKNKISVNIKAGTFDTHKVDKVVIQGHHSSTTDIPNAFKGLSRDNYMPGRYGDVNILKEWVNMDEADFIYGGEELTEEDGDATGSKKTVIKPKTQSKYFNSDSRVEIENHTSDGSKEYNPNENIPYYVSAKYTPYYSLKEEEWLAYDYQNRTDRTIKWYYTLYKSLGDPPLSAELESTAPICNLNDLRTNKGNKITYQNGQMYQLKMRVEEKWVGHNTHTRSFAGTYMFYVSDAPIGEVTKIMNFEVKTTVTGTGEPQNFESFPDAATISKLQEMGIKDDTESSYDYRYYYLDKFGKTVYTKWIDYGSGKPPEACWAFAPLKPGPIDLRLGLLIPGNGGEGSYTKIYKTVFAMPSISVWREGSGDTEFVTPDRNDVVYAITGMNVTLNPGLEFLNELDLKDPQTGKKLTVADVEWEFRELSGTGYAPLDVDVDNNGCCSVDRSGTYRAKFTYDGRTWYSPNPILLSGKNYDNNRMPYITGKNSHTSWSDPHVLQINLNKDANWYTVTEYWLKVKSRPYGASIGSSQKKCDSNGSLDIKKFFSGTTTADNFKPGDYTFEAFVYGIDGDGHNYRMKSEPFTVRFEKESTDTAIRINGETVYDPAKANSFCIPYTVPAGVSNLDFEQITWPADATIDVNRNNRFEWYSEDPDIIQIDSKTGKAMVLRPGTTEVGFHIYEPDGIVLGGTQLRIDVPIAGFEIEPIDYAAHIGESYVNLKPRVKAVWAASGLRITENTDQYLDFDIRSWSTSAMSDADIDNIQYNDYLRFNYRVFTKNGYFLPLQRDSEYGGYVYYSVNADVLEIKGFTGDDKVYKAKEIGAYAAYQGGSENYWARTFCYKETGVYAFEEGDPTISKLCIPTTVFVRDPNTTYLETVNITTREPVKNDYRYEGDDWKDGYYNTYLNGNISSLRGVTAVNGEELWGYSSRVSKLTEPPKGSGNPYEDAKGESSLEWWNGVIEPVYDDKQKPTARYTDGTYFNDVRMALAWKDTAAGQKFAVDPNATIYVNGHAMNNVTIYYDFQFAESLRTSIYFQYYFDVGSTESYTSATVKGICDPRIGEMPTLVEETYVEESEELYVSKLIWFVDKNGNQKYDSGEECRIRYDSEGNYDSANSDLTANGTFRADRKYSVFVEVSSEGGRIANGGMFQLYMTLDNGANALLSVDNSTGGAYHYNKSTNLVGRFDATFIKDDPLAFYRFNEYPGYDADGFASSSYWVKDVETEESMFGKSLLPGKKYEFDVIYVSSDSCRFADDFTVTVDGAQLTDGVTLEADRTRVRIQYSFTLNSNGTKVIGKTVSYNPNNPPIVELRQNGVKIYDAVLDGGKAVGDKITHEFTFDTVNAGKYDLVVIKSGHLLYTVKGIEVSNSDIDLKTHANEKISTITLLAGDVNGDGKINNLDYAVVLNPLNFNKGYNSPSDVKDISADINGDKKINNLDYAIILNPMHFNKSCDVCTLTY